MTLLDRAAILAAQDIKTEEVDVPEWGGKVRVKSMTGVERNAWGRLCIGPDDKFDTTRLAASFAVACCVDEAGAPLFTAEDMDALMAKHGGALARIQAVAERINGIGPVAAEAAKGN